MAWHLRPTTLMPTMRQQVTRTCGTLPWQQSCCQPFAKKARLPQPTFRAAWWCPTGTKWFSAQHQQPRWWIFSFMQQLHVQTQHQSTVYMLYFEANNVQMKHRSAWGPTAPDSSTEAIKSTPNSKWNVDMPSTWLRMSEPQHSCGRSRQQMVATWCTRLPTSSNGATDTCGISTLPSTSWRLWTTEVHGTRPFATAWNTMGPKCCNTCQHRQHQGSTPSWATCILSNRRLFDNCPTLAWKQWNDFEGIQQWWSLWTQFQHGRICAGFQHLLHHGIEEGNLEDANIEGWMAPTPGWNMNGILRQQRWVQHGLPQLSAVKWGQKHPSTWVESISVFRFNRCTLLR